MSSCAIPKATTFIYCHSFTSVPVCILSWQSLLAMEHHIFTPNSVTIDISQS